MTVISTSKAPAAVGPYSQARRHGDLLFVSGQLPLDPASDTMPDDAVQQIEQSLRNIAAIAEAAGTSLANTIKTTVLVTDLSRWGELNSEYARHFQEPYPARANLSGERSTDGRHGGNRGGDRLVGAGALGQHIGGRLLRAFARKVCWRHPDKAGECHAIPKPMPSSHKAALPGCSNRQAR